MTLERFAYQRHVLSEMTEPGDVVLNVGANNDPARLKRDFSDREVLNCDKHHQDLGLDYPIQADHYFDCGQDWPFEDQSAKLVIMGDILEHLNVVDGISALIEAHRVAQLLCVTVPQDPRFIETPLDPSDGKPWQHVNLVSCDTLHLMLYMGMWLPLDFLTVDYVFVPRGFFVLACHLDKWREDFIIDGKKFTLDMKKAGPQGLKENVYTFTDASTQSPT